MPKDSRFVSINLDKDNLKIMDNAAIARRVLEDVAGVKYCKALEITEQQYRDGLISGWERMQKHAELINSIMLEYRLA